MMNHFHHEIETDRCNQKKLWSVFGNDATAEFGKNGSFENTRGFCILLAQSSIDYLEFDQNYHIGDGMKVKQFSRVPLQAFVSVPKM